MSSELEEGRERESGRGDNGGESGRVSLRSTAAESRSSRPRKSSIAEIGGRAYRFGLFKGRRSGWGRFVVWG